VSSFHLDEVMLFILLVANDISRGSYGIAKVRTTLAGAHGIMTASAYLQAGIISAKRDGRHVRLRDSPHPEEMSILASVMGVTQETINHRRLVQEVYDRRVLHRMLGITPQVITTPTPSHTAAHGQTRVAYEESVKTAWEEADINLGSDHIRDADDIDHETESRNGGGRREPQKKRHKPGREQDMHAIFTTDDEDADDGRSRRDGDGLSDDQQEYDLGALDDVEADLVEAGETKYGMERRSSSSAKRDYWLSKGFTGIASDSSED